MLKISIHMQRVKCGKVLKKTIKSIARVLFEKAEITRHAYLVVYIDTESVVEVV
jgi:translation elongation factor P/translation initiation factor 5A